MNKLNKFFKDSSKKFKSEIVIAFIYSITTIINTLITTFLD